MATFWIGDPIADASAAAAAGLTVAVGAGLMIMETGFAPVLLIPVVFAALPWSVRPGDAKWKVLAAAALLLTGWSAVAMASVGMLYIPSAVLMGLAAFRGR